MTRAGICLVALGTLMASTASGETALIVPVKGQSAHYTLQWAERGPTIGKIAIDEAKWLERLRQLQPIRFCPIVPGEAAPYPSCVDKS